MSSYVSRSLFLKALLAARVLAFAGARRARLMLVTAVGLLGLHGVGQAQVPWVGVGINPSLEFTSTPDFVAWMGGASTVPSAIHSSTMEPSPLGMSVDFGLIDANGQVVDQFAISSPISSESAPGDVSALREVTHLYSMQGGFSLRRGSRSVTFSNLVLELQTAQLYATMTVYLGVNVVRALPDVLVASGTPVGKLYSERSFYNLHYGSYEARDLIIAGSFDDGLQAASGALGELQTGLGITSTTLMRALKGVSIGSISVAVPEPSTFAVTALGLAAVSVAGRRRAARAAA